MAKMQPGMMQPADLLCLQCVLIQTSNRAAKHAIKAWQTLHRCFWLSGAIKIDMKHDAASVVT